MRAYSLIIPILFTACTGRPVKDLTELYKAEIIQTELDFAKIAAEKGVASAFYEFADTGAVISSSGVLIRGKEAIRSYYESHLQPGTTLDWVPDFADVSGDIGYTYGKYTHAVPDSTGKITKSHGIFHTVWKRQTDGKWLFVWD